MISAVCITPCVLLCWNFPGCAFFWLSNYRTFLWVLWSCGTKLETSKFSGERKQLACISCSHIFKTLGFVLKKSRKLTVSLSSTASVAFCGFPQFMFCRKLELPLVHKKNAQQVFFVFTTLGGILLHFWLIKG